MRLLNNTTDVHAFWDAVDACSGKVFVCSPDASEKINAKSGLSRYFAVSKLAQEGGNLYEIFCENKADEAIMLNFFETVRNHA